MAASTSSSLLGSAPIPRTRLIGRESERAIARSFLLEDAVPLLTLTGPGGVGKTRLALAITGDVANAFAAGVIWIDLASLADPALVPITIATSLGLVVAPDKPVTEALVHHLRCRQALLLLDNCEHLLVQTAELVAFLLATCPALQLLATSRAPLRLRGEQVLPIDPLPLPSMATGSLEVVDRTEAVRLFVERAQAAQPRFRLTEANAATVATICRQLDGLPLAIELAAARTPILSAETLLTQMTDRLDLSSGGVRDLPARQQTIRATISWSYDLLDPSAQALFRRLAVFVGGFTFQAAQAVTSSKDGSPEDVVRALTTLVDHNLVRRVDGPDDRDKPRFSMLETIREFGLQRLAVEGEEAETRNAHARYFLDLIDALDAAVAPHVPGADRVLGRLDIEHPNLRAALSWFAESGATEEFVRLAGALHAFWLHYGYTHEGRQWLEQALALGGGASAPARVWALVGLFAMLQNQQTDEARALALIKEAVALARESGDALSVGLASIYRGAAHIRAGEIARAERIAHEARAAFVALPQAPWRDRNITHVDWALSNYALLQGDFSGAEARARAVLERQRVLEHEHHAPYPFVSRPQIVLGHIARIRGEHAAALGYYRGALCDATRSAEVRGAVYALGGIAGTLAAVGRWTEAARLFGAIEAACERAGIGFAGYVFDWQRAIGLPEPWAQAGMSFGVAATLRSAVQKRDPRELPPFPDPATAARLWAGGRTVPIDEAIDDALAVDLDASAPLPAGGGPSLPRAMDRFGLSPRECEVLALLCQRLTNAEIGAALFISPRTASRHVANLFNKLGVSSRREAAALAAHHGLI